MQRSRAGRLESLGTLVGGVAHDFNDVLTAILGFGEMAQDAAPAGSDQARQIDRVLQAAQRGRALAELILTFSSGGARQSALFELAPIVEEVLALLSATLRPGVVLALEAPGAQLRGDATQAFEAMLNLCTNALQALLHAEIGEARQPGSSAFQTALDGLRFRYIGRYRRASSIPLQLQVDDLQGQRMSAIADAGRLTDLPLPPGTYQITARLGNYRHRYTVTLEPGTSVHLHLRFGTAGH